MNKWLKIILGITISLIILAVGGTLIFNSMLKRSLPVYSGELKVNGIRSEVKIYRDEYAIPYIFAKYEDDAAFALGYIHAQERMFQMDLARRAGEGRLSEILGAKTLPFDKLFLTVGIKNIAEKILSEVHPSTKKMLVSYANGVNNYLEEAKGRYSIEFDVLGYQPYNWEPVHSIIIIRMMAWELNIGWWSDIAFTHLVQQLGEEKVKEILPEYPENAPTIIPNETKNLNRTGLEFLQIDRNYRHFAGIAGNHIGSNNWVINSNKSVTGKPIIANDPHLAFSLPGKWFVAVIRSDSLNVEGVTLPGVPGIVIGKNKNISWVLTNVMADDSDFYVEELDPANKMYFFNNEWKPLEINTDTIHVKDSADVVFEIASTHRGPIISSIHQYTIMYPDDRYQKNAISMRWTGNDVSDEFYALYSVNKASNWKEFLESVSNFKVPGQNFVYADNDGNIGYICGAKLPIRNNVSSTFVFDGTTDKYDWKGYVPFNEMPFLLNPATNYIASANNKTIQNFKYHISNIWEPHSRITRITGMLESKEKHSVDDFHNYQYDFISPYAEEITSYIVKAFNGIKVTDTNMKIAIDLLESWDFKMDSESQTPSIYAMFYKFLLKNIFEDEMGENLFNEFIYLANIPYRTVLKILKDNSSSWFNNVNTKQIETRDVIIRKSLADALLNLETEFGMKAENWQWGKLHTLTLRHIFSGISPVIDRFVNIGPYKISGDGTTVFNTEYLFSKPVGILSPTQLKPFDVIVGPSMRFIYDFAEPEFFYLILPAGQSGNVMSPHYNDMTEKWLRGGTIKINTDDENIKNGGFQILRLLPQ